MSNKTAPIMTALALGALALTPVFLVSCGNNPTASNLSKHTASSTASTAPITDKSSEVAKVGYSVGYMMGTNVKQGAKDLNTADITKGLEDGFNGKQASLTREQMEKVVMDYQKHQIEKMGKDNLAKGQAFLAENAKKPNIKTTASGLQYEVLKEGNATKPKATDIVAVQYEGKLIDGKVFDSTSMHSQQGQPPQPAVFPLNQVIPGWTEGLQLMGEGAKYRFYVPANLGYGEQGMPQGGIEPNSVLIFDVELVKVNPPADANPTAQSADVADIQAQLKQQIEQSAKPAASQPK